MTAVDEVVFLLDVDNTLLDNDRIVADLDDHLRRECGGESRDRYWTIFEALRVELGYADHLGALQRYRLGDLNDPCLLLMSSFLVDYPFADRLYAGALDVIEHLRVWGPTVNLSDGDVVLQSRKTQRSGLWGAVEGRVLIYLHKEQMLDGVESRYPARHYVMVDDKLRILAAMKKTWGDRKSGESLFYELALEDVTQAGDLFRPVHEATGGVDGWVSLEVSPLLAADTAGSIQATAQLHARAQRANLFIKIPGTAAGLPAIEATIFAGVPVNVTLLFSREQYMAAAEAYMRGIERRIAAGLDPKVGTVASIVVSRWDVAVKDKVPDGLRNRLGIAIAKRTYGAYRELLASTRWHTLANAGARPQRLLWASTGTKDPKASDTLYVEALAAPDTVNTIPENTLQAFADYGRPKDVSLAAQLRREGTESFTKSWNDLVQCLASKSVTLTTTPPAGRR